MCEPQELSEQQIKQKMDTSIELLKSRDIYLLRNDVNERSISHKLGSYLQEQFGDDWNVDCEYNRRNDTYPKELHGMVKNVTSDDTDAITVYPDIIVHQRGTQRNLLVIEIKKTSNRNQQAKNYDLKKLAAYKSDPEYKYQFAAFLEVKIGSEPQVKWDFI